MKDWFQNLCLALVAGGLLTIAANWHRLTPASAAPPAPPPVVVPVPVPAPVPAEPPKRKPVLPWRESVGLVMGGPVVGASVGGNTAPDGTPIHCDLPADQHCKNISSRGQGCCVQTSINHSARWQNVPALIGFHQWVREKGIPGGAYPGAVDQRLPRCAKERGYPVPPYIQIQNSRDLEILRLACKTGRMPAVTYSRSPTGRYGGGRIAHMVSMLHCDQKYVGILDNNYVGADKIEWMDPEKEFLNVCNPSGYWAVILLDPPPPPPPTNKRGQP